MSAIRPALRVAVALCLLPAVAWADEPDGEEAELSLVVSASAYNSVPKQTHGNPNVGAWGDRIEPGIRAIAVSRDLVALGLTRGVSVTIDGLPGVYRVLDKMGKRWKRKVDIYMGDDVTSARRWGVRRVLIRWNSGAVPAAGE